MITIIVSETTPSLNKMLRAHWSVRKRLKDKWFIWMLAGLTKDSVLEHPGPNDKYIMTITRYGRELDFDNFCGGAKEIIVDQLKAVQRGKATYNKLTCIYDDDPSHVEIQYRQGKALGKKRTEIWIEKITT